MHYISIQCLFQDINKAVQAGKIDSFFDFNDDRSEYQQFLSKVDDILPNGSDDDAYEVDETDESLFYALKAELTGCVVFHIRCTSHIVQLVVIEGINNCPSFKRLLAKIRAIATACK